MDTTEMFRIFRLKWVIHCLMFLKIMTLIGTREVLCYFRMPFDKYGQNRLITEFIWKLLQRITKGNSIITMFRATLRILGFQGLPPTIYECREGSLALMNFNTSDFILETPNAKASMYVWQSSILHSQIKFLELPRRNSGIFFGYSNLSTTFVASIN